MKIKKLIQENEFYNQIIALFITSKKLMEKEKKYCYMLATETNTLKKT